MQHSPNLEKKKKKQSKKKTCQKMVAHLTGNVQFIQEITERYRDNVTIL